MTSRPANAIDDALDRVSCASLVDAVGRVHGHRADILGLVSPSPRSCSGRSPRSPTSPTATTSRRRSSGSVSCSIRPSASRPRGTVVVLSSGGHPDASHGGGTKLSRLHHSGAAGVLADGRLRDFDQLGDLRFATWCRGEATRWGGDTVVPFAANVAVEVGGVCVVPGDYVYADASGAVVIPEASLKQVIGEALDVEAEDARFAEEIAGEDPAALRRGGSSSER